MHFESYAVLGNSEITFRTHFQNLVYNLTLLIIIFSKNVSNFDFITILSVIPKIINIIFFLFLRSEVIDGGEYWFLEGVLN